MKKVFIIKTKQNSSPPRGGSGGGGRGGYQPNPDDWKCNICGNYNFARRDRCNRCKEDKAKCIAENAADVK